MYYMFIVEIHKTKIKQQILVNLLVLCYAINNDKHGAF
jgi:hypothetical protein